MYQIPRTLPIALSLPLFLTLAFSLLAQPTYVTTAPPPAAATSTPDACRPGLSNAQIGLTGTGMVIWKVPDAEGGDPSAITTAARNAGLSFVLIKVADGANPYGIEKSAEAVATPSADATPDDSRVLSAPEVSEKDLVAPVVQSLQAAGIKVWGWHYLYGEYPEEEAAQAIRRIGDLGLDGYQVYAQADFDQPGKAADADTFMKNLRQVWPDLPIALSSFAFPSDHPEFPWGTFLCHVDLVMPEIFWVNAHNPDEQLTRSVAEYADLSPVRPIVPIGSAYSERGWRPTTDDITLFRDTARSLGLPAVGYWSWDQARSPGNQDLWAAISGASTWPQYTLGNGWLPSDDVRALLYNKASDGVPNLFAATGVGVTRINGRSAQSWPSEEGVSRAVHDLLMLDGKTLLVASEDGLWTVAMESRQATTEAVYAMEISTDERLWAITESSLIAFSLPDLEQVASFDAESLGLSQMLALATGEGQVWVGGGGDLVNISGERVIPLALPADLAADAQVRALALGPDGALWVGTDRGAARWDGANWQVFTPANGLVSYLVNDIAFDQAGGVWFATDAGAIRYDSGQNTWRRYFEAAYPIMPSDNVNTLLVDPEGTVWLGTDAGVAGLQGQPGVTLIYQHDGKGPASAQVTTLLEDGEGNLWVGTLNAGLSVRLAGTANASGTGGEWRYFDRDTSMLPDNMVAALLLDGEGRVWAGTPGGLAICTLDGCQPPKVEPALDISDVSAMALDAQGGVWAAGETALAWCHPNCQSVASVPDVVTLLEPASDGRVWAATLGQGVYMCQELDCQALEALNAILLAQAAISPVAMLATDDGAVLVSLNTGELLRCNTQGCEVMPTPVDTQAIGMAHDSLSRLWILASAGLGASQAELYTCTSGGCTRQDGAIQSASPLPAWLQMTPGPSGDMWIAGEGIGAYYCPDVNRCVRPSSDASGPTQAIWPYDLGRAWVGDQANGLMSCTTQSCFSIKATGVTVEAYEPSPGQPWVRLTPNAALYGQPEKLVDVDQVLIEFEGGGLTSRALELSYQVTLSVEGSDQPIVSQAFSRGAIGSASPGQVRVGEETLGYMPYLLEISTEDTRGNRGAYQQRFELQASPNVESVQISTRPENHAGDQAQANLPVVKSYLVTIQVDDPDSLDQPFTLQYRWVSDEVPETQAPWETLAQDHILTAGRFEGDVDSPEGTEYVSVFSVRVIDADGNPGTRVTPISFLIPRPLWLVAGTYILGALSVAAVGFYALRRYSGLPSRILARQGRHILNVSLGYRRFEEAWERRTPFERLLLLKMPTRQPFKSGDLLAQLETLETPSDEAQVERALQVLAQTQFVRRSGEVYQAAEPAQLSALQAQQGQAGVQALCLQVRTEHPLVAETLRFFTAAGFDCSPVPDRLALTCIPALQSWQKVFAQPLYARVFPDQPIHRKDVLQAHEEAHARPDYHQRIIFVVVDHTPTDSAWLQIGTLRAEDVQVIPIDDTVIQAGREQQKEGEALRSHLRRFLGRRRDLYNVRDPVADRLNFFGREARASELLETLFEGHPVFLLALRKMGKSSLLLYLRDKATFPVAHVDLQAGSRLSWLYTRLVNSWSRSLRVKLPEFSWQPPEPPDPRTSDPSTFAAALVEATRHLMTSLENAGHNPQVGIFIDEIEVIAPQETEGNGRPHPGALERYLVFARTLRGLLQETTDLALLVVGVDPRLNRVNRWGGEQNPFYQFFREEYLGPLSPEDCIQMVRNIGQQMGLAYAEPALGFIAQVSGGHPFLARQLCSLAVRDLGEDASGNITLPQMQAAAGRFVREPNTESLLNERGMWGEVTNSELWSPAQIIENESILFELTKRESLPEAELLNAAKDPIARERSLYELKHRSVLTRLKDMLRIQFGLFRDWIRRYKLGDS